MLTTIAKGSRCKFQFSTSKAPQDPLSNRIDKCQVLDCYHYVLAYVMTTQANQGVFVPSNATTSASRVRDFIRMNPPEFYGSKVDEDP